jgi:hypothetical protein
MRLWGPAALALSVISSLALAQPPEPAPTQPAPGASASGSAAPAPPPTTTGSAVPAPPPGYAPYPYAPPPPGYAPPPGYPPQGYPSPYGYPPPPGYAPYPYPPPPGYYAPQAPPPPREMNYEEGQEIPAGYHVESRVRRGPIIAGSIMFGTTYFVDIIIASESSSKDADWLYLPVVGPWSLVSDCNDTNDECTFLMMHALTHTMGAALLVYGIAAPKKRLVRDDARLIVHPARVGSGNGLVLSGAF